MRGGERKRGRKGGGHFTYVPAQIQIPHGTVHVRDTLLPVDTVLQLVYPHKQSSALHMSQVYLPPGWAIYNVYTEMYYAYEDMHYGPPSSHHTTPHIQRAQLLIYIHIKIPGLPLLAIRPKPPCCFLIPVTR